MKNIKNTTETIGNKEIADHSEEFHFTKAPKNFVHTLRQHGMKVRVKHYRWVVDTNAGYEVYLAHVTKKDRKEMQPSKRPEILSNGGRTEVEITTAKGQNAFGSSVCSTLDTYNKSLGIYIAAHRALESMKPKDKKNTESSEKLENSQ